MSNEITLILVIILLAIVIVCLFAVLVYLVRWIIKTEEKIDDLSLIIHFATDNYLLNERKKSKDNGRDTGTGNLS